MKRSVVDWSYKQAVDIEHLLAVVRVLWCFKMSTSRYQ